MLPVTPIAIGLGRLNEPCPLALNNLPHENRPLLPLLIPTVTPRPEWLVFEWILTNISAVVPLAEIDWIT